MELWLSKSIFDGDGQVICVHSIRLASFNTTDHKHIYILVYLSRRVVLYLFRPEAPHVRLEGSHGKCQIYFLLIFFYYKNTVEQFFCCAQRSQQGRIFLPLWISIWNLSIYVVNHMCTPNIANIVQHP